MNKRITVRDIRNRKLIHKKQEPIVSLVCYTAQMARLINDEVDVILVGDSLGMTIYGYKNTLSVTLDMMINHGAAVVRSTTKPHIVVDMPFGSYEESPEVAFRSASKIMRETGAQSVKLEGGEEFAETIFFLSQRGIPVMGHIGLMPQRIQTLGGFFTQGKTDKESTKLMNDAIAIAEAGAFSMVIEAIPEEVATNITQNIEVPTIGIGGGRNCDGQILVTHDILNLYGDFTPKFVKKYGKIDNSITNAVKKYSQEVKKKKFPAKNNIFTIKK
jgi:3-methyl-2-oxobutanoate hydroxymethyltransferase